jgi:hypothetical protein
MESGAGTTYGPCCATGADAGEERILEHLKDRFPWNGAFSEPAQGVARPVDSTGAIVQLGRQILRSSHGVYSRTSEKELTLMGYGHSDGRDESAGPSADSLIAADGSAWSMQSAGRA